MDHTLVIVLAVALSLCVVMLGYKEMERYQGVEFSFTRYLRRYDGIIHALGFRLLKDTVSLERQINILFQRYVVFPLKRTAGRTRKMISRHYINLLDRLKEQHLRRGGQKSLLSRKRNRLKDR